MHRSTDSGPTRGDDDRGFFDRAEDEVRAWFGDDAAGRRRERDHRDDPRSRDHGGSRSSGDYGGHSFRDYTGPEADRYRRNYEVGNEADRRAREGYSSGRFFYETADRSGAREAGTGDSRRSSGMEERGEDRDAGTGGSSHAGRGPSGYSRSTERITEDVNEALMDDHDVDATHVQVSVEDGEVTLEGTVSSRSEKRRAETVAERCRGVRDVHNRLRIARDMGTTGGVGGMGMSPDLAGGTATPGATTTGTTVTFGSGNSGTEA